MKSADRILAALAGGALLLGLYGNGDLHAAIALAVGIPTALKAAALAGEELGRRLAPVCLVVASTALVLEKAPLAVALVGVFVAAFYLAEEVRETKKDEGGDRAPGRRTRAG